MPLSHFVPAYPSPSPYPQIHSLVGLCLYSRLAEFRVMIVKMTQNLRNKIEKIQKTFNKDLEERKSSRTVMKNTILKFKIL